MTEQLAYVSTRPRCAGLACMRARARGRACAAAADGGRTAGARSASSTASTPTSVATYWCAAAAAAAARARASRHERDACDSILLTTHSMDEAELLADRVLVGDATPRVGAGGE